jgi:hypothetical protein
MQKVATHVTRFITAILASNIQGKTFFSMLSTFHSEPHEFSRTLPLYFIIELIQFIAC